MVRLYLDEDMANFLPQLRSIGHDVRFAAEVGAARSDLWHLRQASIDRRVLITFNERDFRQLHRLWTSLRTLELMDSPHEGILTATAQVGSNAWLLEIDQLLAIQPELVGRMLTWHPAKQEWREDRWRPEEEG